jgi:hypothetical protein
MSTRQDYYQRSIKALQLAGMSDRTQESYTRSIRKLVDFYGKTPDRITETELESYFLHCRNVDSKNPTPEGPALATPIRGYNTLPP